MYMQDDKRHIIDGKQRLETIRRFFKGEWIDECGNKTEFALDFEDTDNPRQGYTFKQIMEDIDKSGDKKRLSDVYLNAITIRATSTDENKRMDSIYYIFERLNTGGVSLTPSEIRLSIWNQMQLLKDIKDLLNNCPNSLFLSVSSSSFVRGSFLSTSCGLRPFLLGFG
jgi:hypothetical protein